MPNKHNLPPRLEPVVPPSTTNSNTQSIPMSGSTSPLSPTSPTSPTSPLSPTSPSASLIQRPSAKDVIAAMQAGNWRPATLQRNSSLTSYSGMDRNGSVGPNDSLRRDGTLTAQQQQLKQNMLQMQQMQEQIHSPTASVMGARSVSPPPRQASPPPEETVGSTLIRPTAAKGLASFDRSGPGRAMYGAGRGGYTMSSLQRNTADTVSRTPTVTSASLLRPNLKQQQMGSSDAMETGRVIRTGTLRSPSDDNMRTEVEGPTPIKFDKDSTDAPTLEIQNGPKKGWFPKWPSFSSLKEKRDRFKLKKAKSLDYWSKQVKPPEEFWEVGFPSADNGKKRTRQTNYIRTTKYTLLSFFPMTLFDQFKRFHNLYFLAGALSVLFQSSSLSPASQILPLVIVLAFSLAKEAYEDRTRYEADRDANNGLVQIMRNGQRVETIRMYVQTGDIMFLEKNQKSPVDAIILSSSYSDGTVFVETSELDGETNLKHKSAVNAFKHMQTDEDVRKLRGQISCELPNEKLNVFEGRIAISSPEPMPPVTVSLANLFLRGAVLRNTDFCWAVVVYTGTNTKIVKNLKRPKMKQSSLTGQLNKLVLVALAYNMFLLFTSVVLEYVQYKKILDKERARKLTHPNDYAIHWYVGPVDDNPGRHVFYTIVSFFCMYTYVIPISLFVTIEMVRLLQAKFMIWDSKMRISRLDAEGKVIKLKARANNSNLNEELSVVEYIFSDKTGTLTMNEMTAAAWYVGDQVVPEMTDPGLMGRKLDDPNSDDYEQECMMRFGHALTLCHDVVPSEDPKTGKMIYEAQSPDESALLHGIANSHFTLLGRSKDTITIDSRGQLMTFEQLGTLEFNSDRKRMSVIVKTENEGIIMYCKGADNVVFGRLDPDSEWNQHGVLDRAEIALTQFAEAGLRTLVVAWKPLTRMEYEEFRLLYDEAETSLVEREQKVADVAEIIERNMRFLGCTAIEDRLQPQVPETIEYLLAAGMKIWLLTGDKMETAVNIGMSSKLISPDMDMIILNRDTDEAITAQIQESLDSILTRVPPRRSALVIGGQILTRIFAPNSPHQQPLLRLASHCVTVICCRVTPMQKALVVRLVQKTLKCVTLAIGDGANDVSMIQSATVGVGVFGREGAQAVRAADYAIPEFRFLARLCGVHGRWARNRLSGLVFFSFYKNLVCITVQWLFGFLCLWSGQLVYEEIFFTGYNILFTSIPPFCYAIFNYDVPDRILRRNPELYRQVRKGLFWSRRLIFTTSASALMHSIIIFGFVWLTFFDNILDPNGHATSYYVQCFIFSTPMLCVVLMRSAVHSQIWLGRWMYITGGVLLASLAFDLLVKVVVEWLGFMQANTVDMLHVTPGFWIIGALIVCACFTIDWTVKYFYHHFFPTDSDILLEDYRQESWATQWWTNLFHARVKAEKDIYLEEGESDIFGGRNANVRENKLPEAQQFTVGANTGAKEFWLESPLHDSPPA